MKSLIDQSIEKSLDQRLASLIPPVSTVGDSANRLSAAVLPSIDDRYVKRARERSRSPLSSISEVGTSSIAPSIAPSTSTQDHDDDDGISAEADQHAADIWANVLDLENFEFNQKGNDKRFNNFLTKHSIKTFRPPEVPIEIDSLDAFKVNSHQQTVVVEQKLIGALGHFAASTAAASALLLSAITDKLRASNVSEEIISEVEDLFSVSQQTILLDEGLGAIGAKFNKLSESRRKHAVKVYEEHLRPRFEKVPPSVDSLFEETQLAAVSERIKTSSAMKAFRFAPEASSSTQKRSSTSKFRPNKSFWNTNRNRSRSSGTRGRGASTANRSRGKPASDSKPSGSKSRSSAPK